MPAWEASTLPTEDSGERISREYEWQYGKRTFTWQTEIPAGLYETQKRRHRIYDYGAYVADRHTQQFFTDLANEMQSVASENRYDRPDVVTFASRFVQSLPYAIDSVSTGYSNYPRYPIETLVDETGDCEDTSLLLAAILHGLGYRVGLLEFDSHLGVGVDVHGVSGNVAFDGVEYSYVEPTDTGWDVGRLPPRLEGESVTLHRVDDSPALYAEWQGETRGETFSCGGGIVNAGEGTARNVVFQVFLEDRHGETVTAVQQEWQSIGPDDRVTWSDRVPVEADRLVTPRWVLGVEGVVHDEGEGDQQRT